MWGRCFHTPPFRYPAQRSRPNIEGLQLFMGFPEAKANHYFWGGGRLTSHHFCTLKTCFFTNKTTCSNPEYTFGCPPIQDAIVTNEGSGWDSLLKIVHNPGVDWHPGWGVVPKYTLHTPPHFCGIRKHHQLKDTQICLRISQRGTIWLTTNKKPSSTIYFQTCTIYFNQLNVGYIYHTWIPYDKKNIVSQLTTTLNG